MKQPHGKARKLVVGGAVWWWLYGSRVCIWDPDGAKHTVPAWTIKGVTPDTLERGHWKRTSDGMLTPFEVADYIKSELMWVPLPT